MQCPKCGREATGEQCKVCGEFLTVESPKWYAEGVAHLSEEKQYAMANELLEEGLQRHPESAMLWYNAGVLAELLKNPKDALTYYQKACKFKPNSEKYCQALERLLGRPVPRPAAAQRPAAETKLPESAAPAAADAPLPEMPLQIVLTEPETADPVKLTLSDAIADDATEMFTLTLPPAVPKQLEQTDSAAPMLPTPDAVVPANPLEVMIDEPADESMPLIPADPLPAPEDASWTLPPAPPAAQQRPDESVEEEVAPALAEQAAAVPRVVRADSIAPPAHDEAVADEEMPSVEAEAAYPLQRAGTPTIGACWEGWRPISRISGYVSIASFLFVLVVFYAGKEKLIAVSLPVFLVAVVLYFVARALSGDDPAARRR